MSVVVGTAGHIDHGKTTLLRALTGIDADRLPEERRRGMTIDVGYAHLALPDGSVLDFVDVPGHDRLVGNMLVGAGEIDAALLVVAADDGPNAQTMEHLELLDAMGILDGLVAVTKSDVVDAGRVGEVMAAVDALVARTRLAGAPVIALSGVTGAGLDELRGELVALRDRVEARLAAGVGGGARLAIDRSFAMKGRGSVVTGSLRGGAVATGAVLRLVPGGGEVRVREVQVRGGVIPASEGGRTALLVAGAGLEDLERGRVLTTDDDIVATSRVLVAVRPPAGLASPGRGSARAGRATGASGLAGTVGQVVPGDRERLRFHLGTAQAGALVIRGPREAVDLPDGSALAILRLDGEVAAAPGDRFALRRPSPGSSAGGGVVLDAMPPRGVSRRRLTPGRAAALATAVASLQSGVERAATEVAAARLDMHGVLREPGGWRIAGDIEAAFEETALELVRAHHAAQPESPGATLPAVRTALAATARRRATLGRAAADELARSVVDRLVTDGTLAREGDRLRDPARPAGLPAATQAAMDRLELALSVAAPPSLAAAARETGCPPAGLRALETAGRLVRLEDDLGWATGTYRDLVRRALAMAAVAPLSPAAYRDATGTSRRYVLAILEDLDRRGILRRTDAGHVLGPRTIAGLQARAAAAGRGSGVGPGDAPGLAQDAEEGVTGRRAGRGAGRVRPAAIVLAGGPSSRFGANKLAADLEGRPVLEHALRSAAAVADHVVLVLGPDDPVPWLPADLGAEVVLTRDAVAHRGPLAGLAAGLAALPRPRDVAIVVAGDMPTLVPAVLELLAGVLAGGPSLGVACLEAEPASPLPAAVRPSVAGPAAAALLEADRRSLRGLIAAVPTAIVPAAEWRAIDPDGVTLRDVDTPSDLAGR